MESPAVADKEVTMDVYGDLIAALSVLDEYGIEYDEEAVKALIKE